VAGKLKYNGQRAAHHKYLDLVMTDINEHWADWRPRLVVAKQSIN